MPDPTSSPAAEYQDIRNEGIALFGANAFTLASPKEATPEERLQRAERNFDYWFGSANDFLKMYEVGASMGLHVNAAFQLHQTAERLYTATSMVFTGYKRKQNDLEKLARRGGPAPRRPARRALPAPPGGRP